MLIILNTVLQHLQSIESGSLSMTDGRPSLVLPFGNHLSRACSIVTFNDAQVGMVLQIVACLHQGHRMRVYLGNGIPVIIGQTADTMSDVQFMLAHNGCTAITQQLIVV